MKKRYLSIVVVASRDGEQFPFTKSANMDYVIGDPDQQMAGINHQIKAYFNELKRLSYKVDSLSHEVVELEDNTNMDEAE